MISRCKKLLTKKGNQNTMSKPNEKPNEKSTETGHAQTQAIMAGIHAALHSDRQAILEYIAEQRADAAEPQVHYRLDRVAEFIRGRMGQ